MTNASKPLLDAPCKHREIRTWLFEDGSAPGLWSCAECERRFEPMVITAPSDPVQVGNYIVRGGKVVEWEILNAADERGDGVYALFAQEQPAQEKP